MNETIETRENMRHVRECIIVLYAVWTTMGIFPSGKS